MDDLTHGIGREVCERQDRVERLDARVVDFSRRLVKEEASSRELFIENEYFMKLSESGFSGLFVPEQMMWLAFWFAARNRSVPGRSFSFDSRTAVDGVVADFVVALETEAGVFKAALLSDPSGGRRQKVEAQGFLVLNVPIPDMGRRPMELAEEVFSFLESRSQAGGRAGRCVRDLLRGYRAPRAASEESSV